MHEIDVGLMDKIQVIYDELHKRDEKHAWFHFLGFGGFAYFEKDAASEESSCGTLLQLNAITFKKTTQALH